MRRISSLSHESGHRDFPIFPGAETASTERGESVCVSSCTCVYARVRAHAARSVLIREPAPRGCGAETGSSIKLLINVLLEIPHRATHARARARFLAERVIKNREASHSDGGRATGTGFYVRVRTRVDVRA